MQRIQGFRRIFVILSMMCRADTSVIYVGICHRIIVRLNGTTYNDFRSMCIRKESVRLYFSFHFFKLLGVKYSGGLKDLIFLDCVGIRPERARTRFAFRTSLFSFPIHSPPLASGKTKQVCPLCRPYETLHFVLNMWVKLPNRGIETELKLKRTNIRNVRHHSKNSVQWLLIAVIVAVYHIKRRTGRQERILIL